MGRGLKGVLWGWDEQRLRGMGRRDPSNCISRPSKIRFAEVGEVDWNRGGSGLPRTHAGFVRCATSMESPRTIPFGAFGWTAGPGKDCPQPSHCESACKSDPPPVRCVFNRIFVDSEERDGRCLEWTRLGSCVGRAAVTGVRSGGGISRDLSVSRGTVRKVSSPSKAHVPRSFDPGEACRFDWSHEDAVLGGKSVRVKVAHVRLCRGRMFFVRSQPRESQEMVFDAREKAFAFFGGSRGGDLRQHADGGRRCSVGRRIGNGTRGSFSCAAAISWIRRPAPRLRVGRRVRRRTRFASRAGACSRRVLSSSRFPN